jgi:hypothetical protein
VDNYGRRLTSSNTAVKSEKCTQIALRNADNTANSEGHEFAARLDPTAHRSFIDVEKLGDLSDREKLDLIGLMARALAGAIADVTQTAANGR